MFLRNINILLFVFTSSFCFGQDLVPYSKDYEFNEGVFLSLEHFKNNAPITKAMIVSGIPKTQTDFFTELVEQKTIVFKDSAGAEKTIQTASIWGYCQNRSIYLNFNKEFTRLNVIGNICHFTSMVTVQGSYRDPMDYNYGINNTYQELRQFVYDTKSNKVLDFNSKNMELLLSDDEVLHKEFMVLKKRQKTDSIFIYLRKYNEKHPLYLSKN